MCGLRVESVQKKLLAEAALTLECAVKLAQADEIARQETKAMRHDTRRRTK